MSEDVLEIHFDEAMDELFAELSTVVDDITKTSVETHSEAPASTKVSDQTYSVAIPSTEAAKVGCEVNTNPEAPKQLSEGNTQPKATKRVSSKKKPRSIAKLSNHTTHPRQTAPTANAEKTTGAKPTMGTDQKPVPRRQARAVRKGSTNIQAGSSSTQTRNSSTQTPYHPAAYSLSSGPSSRMRQPASQFPKQTARNSLGRQMVNEGACRPGPVSAHPRSGPIGAQLGHRLTPEFDSYDKSTWPKGLLAIAAKFQGQVNRGVNISRYAFIHMEDRHRYRVTVKRDGEIHVKPILAPHSQQSNNI